MDRGSAGGAGAPPAPDHPLPPIRLGNQHPPHRLRSVGLRSELDDQRRQIRLQLLPKGFHRDAIHPGLPTIAAHRLIRGSQPPQVQHLPHETVELPPLLVWRASRRAALLAFPRRDRRLSPGNLPRLRLSTQHRVTPVLPLLWTPFASRGSAFADPHAPRCRHAGRAALTTRRRYYEVRSEEHTSELQSHSDLVCRLLLEKKKNTNTIM